MTTDSITANPQPAWIAFAQNKCIAAGAPRAVAAAVKAHVDDDKSAARGAASVLIFDARSSAPVEIDLRGALSTVLKRLPVTPQPQTESAVPAATAERAPGRPKLGVIAREVTLLPRHWEWLATQPGGASVALRKLVEEARRCSKEADRIRQAQEAAYRFMNAVAGDKPRFEDATRALFAGDFDRLGELIAKWPRDIRSHTLLLAKAAIVSSAESPR